MDWHPWNNYPQFSKNLQDKKKRKSGLARGNKKRQTTKPKENLGRKKRYRKRQNPRRLMDKKMEPVTKVQGGKCKLTKKTCQVKCPEYIMLQRKPSVEAKSSGMYAPLSSSSESETSSDESEKSSNEGEIEEIEKPCTNRLLPPLIDLTTEDDATATEDILILSSSNLDDSVMLLNLLDNGSINKQTDIDSQQNLIEATDLPHVTEGMTDTLKTHCRAIPDSQKAVPKRTTGMKRHRSNESLTDAIIGHLLFQPSFETELTLMPDVLAKKKRTICSFKQYSSPLTTKQFPTRKKGASWDAATKQLQRTVENNLMVQRCNLNSSRDETRKTATDNGVKLCSKENMDPANQLQCMVEKTSPTQPVDVGLALREGKDMPITKTITETCSEEVIDLSDSLPDIDSIEIQNAQNTVSKNTAEPCSEEIPGSFLPDIQIISEDAATDPMIGDITVPKRTKKKRKKNCSASLSGTNSTNVTQPASCNEMERCAVANSAAFNASVMPPNSNTPPNITQFSHFNEAQKRRTAVQQMISGGRIDSNTSCNLVHVPVGSLRPIVIDGSNVARTHGTATGTFSCRGIAICIEHFLARGHSQVTAFVPQFRRNLLQTDHQVTDQWILEKLAKLQMVVFTPSRTLYRRTIASYDDRFIVDLACQTGGVIVSNDNFRDIAKESPAWRQTVEQRLLMYLFVGDIFMIPEDPFGRHGPNLRNFLSFPTFPPLPTFPLLPTFPSFPIFPC